MLWQLPQRHETLSVVMIDRANTEFLDLNPAPVHSHYVTTHNGIQVFHVEGRTENQTCASNYLKLNSKIRLFSVNKCMPAGQQSRKAQGPPPHPLRLLSSLSIGRLLNGKLKTSVSYLHKTSIFVYQVWTS